MEDDGHTLTIQRYVVIFEAVEPSPLAIKKSKQDELWDANNYEVFSIFRYAFILAQTYEDLLHLSKKNKDGHQRTQYHPTTPLEKYTTQEILLCTDRLWGQSLDRSVDANESLNTK